MSNQKARELLERAKVRRHHEHGDECWIVRRNDFDQALAEFDQPEPAIKPWDFAIPCPDECGGVLEVKEFIDRPTCNECGKVYILVPKQSEPKCKTCGDCIRSQFCTHERKTTHNKKGECPDYQELKQPEPVLSNTEFEEWFAKEYPLPPTIERGPIGRDFKDGCRKAWEACLKCQQPVPSEFTKGFRELIELAKNHLSNVKIGRLQTKGLEACDIIDRQAEENKRLEAMYEAAKGDLEDVMNGHEETDSLVAELQAENKKLKWEIQTLQNARKREKYTLRKKQENAVRLDAQIKKLAEKIESFRPLLKDLKHEHWNQIGWMTHIKNLEEFLKNK